MRLIYAAALFAQEHGGGSEQGGAGGAEPSSLDLILPALPELIWGAVTFAVVLFVLTKKAFPAIRKSVEAREERIAADLKAAEEAKAEAQREQEEYKRQIADARGEANRIIEEARQSAEQVRKDLIAKAETEAETVVKRAQEQLEGERTRTLSELQTTVGDLAIELAEKVVGRALDQGTHRELVDAYIKEVGTMSGNGKNH